mmetsp:Transcript_36970/g.47778  ORF Transcript_36970/g.47778 Transcript_36970/m.47778 type:complete len:84 (-) Transcript_36970:268-519(-)
MNLPLCVCVCFMSIYIFVCVKMSEVLWVGEEEKSDSGGGGGSLQDAFAQRKKANLSENELNKRHRRTMKKAAASDTGPFAALT